MLSTGNPSGERTEGAKNWFIEKSKILVFSLFVIGISWVVTFLIQIKER